MANTQIIVRLKLETPIVDSDILRDVAVEHELFALRDFLDATSYRSRRVAWNVPVAELLRREAAVAKSKYKPTYSLTLFWRIEVAKEDNPDDVVGELQSFRSDIGDAYIEGTFELANTIAPLSGYRVAQRYLNPAPQGINAYSAWARRNGMGEGVGVVDLEIGWILTHEDLPSPQLLFNDNSGNNHNEQDHGAAVLAVIGARHDWRGIHGIAPNLEFLDAVSHYRAADNVNDFEDVYYDVVPAIQAATARMRRGDILVLEIEVKQGNAIVAYPCEYDSASYTAIQLAVAEGYVVIEAAGNSGVDIDGELPPVESGATLVGAGYSEVTGSPSGHARVRDSNFGQRVHCYAWGDSIVTAGYGDLSGTPPGADNSYTDSFSQTSGATAIIAGVAAVVQSWVKARCMRPLSSAQMRSILSDTTTGTPQDVPSGQPLEHIGVMPDLSRILGCRLWFRVVLWCLADRLRRLVGIQYVPDERQQEHRYE